MTNPNFTATLSTNDLYRDLDTSVCLTDLLDGYDSDILALEEAIDGLDSDYASVNHTHSGYATTAQITALQDAISSKANSDHTHTGYAASSHTHSDYATVGALDALNDEVDGKADSNHTHSEYADSSHSHSEYAAVSHTHADYAAVSHEHSDYATVTALESLSDEVDGKASSTHTHDEYASSSHAHDDRYYTESEVDAKLAAKSDTSHNHDDDYDASGAAASALTSANAYTDAEIANLLNNSTTAVDSIMELAEAMEDNADAITALESIAASKASASDLTSHTGNTTIHITATERTNWNAAKTHADSAHAPSNAQANQNAFSNVTVGSTTIAADTEADTLTLIAGSNVTLTPNATNDGITIAANDTVYTHPATSGNKHIPSGGSSGQILRWSADGTAVWGADNDTTYSAATQSVAGLMSAADKSKLDGIASGANAYTLPAAGSSLGGVKSGGDVTISSGTITVNDDSHNHVISNVDGLQSALDGKAATSHNHDTAYISKDLQMTADNGDISISWSGKNVVTEFTNLASGMYTAYSPAGNTNNPNSSESFRFMVHKTGSASYGWIMAYGAQGSVYTGYIDNGNWKGWKAIFEANPQPLWTGASYMTEVHTITPSKTLSQCRNGWLLLWSDYDPGDGANNTDFYASAIFKRAYTGQAWNGGEWYCDVPSYSAGTATDSEQRVIKLLKIYDTKIVGTANNSAAPRNDVCLRAIYEF